MNAAVLLIISIAILLIGYIFYGRWLSKKWGVDPNKATPAHTMEDGVDYVPAKAPVLMGHHFSSIAGAGPINGPIQAAVFGWVPVALWVLIGGIFFGGVHDYGALFASVRNKGKSIGTVIEDSIGLKAKRLFIIFAYLTLLLVVAAFGSIVANTFKATYLENGAIDYAASAANASTAMISIFFIVLAILFGFFVYRRNAPLGVSTIIGVVLIAVAMYVGLNWHPIYLSYETWMIICGVYILIASVTPVWILLQPRDYLSSFLLYGMMILAVVGIICSIIGSFLVKTKENASQQALLKSLRTGTYTAAILAAVLAAPLCLLLLPNDGWGVYVAILCGLIGGCAIGYFTEYYTSDTYKPTQELAAASETGSATIIIGGISLGLKSTLTSILIVAAAVLISYFAAGGSKTIVDGAGHFTEAFNKGLYGIGIAGVGMLSTLGITLATDAYGPVADNAGGIAEMAGLPEEVRERTDALDSLGNTTAATGKGFAIGSASLTALALLVSYVNIVQDNTEEILNFTLTSPTVLVGLFIGAMLTFVFSAFTMSAVQRAAQSIVVEVRRQFKEIPGIMEYKADPDYAQCVSLCTQGALHEMVAPALLAIVVPLATGLILGPTGVVGLLGGVSVTGFAMAVFMSNAGGAWDNAKKYIEGGHHGGKGSEQHKAAVVGDTVGDPFKDTSGPSLNILIKLCSTVSIVFSGLILAFHLI